VVDAEQPDLVILDLVMPGISGMDVLRTLRQEPDTRPLPVIVRTARNAHGDVLDGWLGGADRYPTKPSRTQELLAAVERSSPLRHSGSSTVDAGPDVSGSNAWSGRPDSNRRPPAPKAGALTKLRYAPTQASIPPLAGDRQPRSTELPLLRRSFANRRSARPRWLMACFSSAVSCAIVHSCPSGMKIGS
jgi:hypothetical protein